MKTCPVISPVVSTSVRSKAKVLLMFIHFFGCSHCLLGFSATVLPAKSDSDAMYSGGSRTTNAGGA